MKLRFTPRALADRDAMFDYLNRRSPESARRVVARIDASLRLLLEQPLGGYQTDVDTVRVVFIGRYPYKLFYRIRDETLEVITLRHTVQQLLDLS